ncbi:hybrid sensor histidine kinase/response regulator [Tautonia sociabilis]|uniref:histidine kinase n=1 Tax=Tautonia sociabilis TaxID=2080755 RepID=A0A432MDT2_9BACT|nr:PAS domain S-box protein [Tautonia sociabilis]RUL83099.1 PAS domain S-box protein [Tautonia sociabilis]
MQPNRRRWLLNQLLALGAVVLATGLRLALEGLLGPRQPYATYYVAVLFAALYLGLGPALTTAVLGLTIGHYLFIFPYKMWFIADPADLVVILTYIFVAGASIILGESSRRLLRRLETEADIRRELERAERRQRERLEATLKSLGEGVIVTGSDGRVAMLNPIAEELTGWTSAEAVGRPLAKVFHTRDRRTTQTEELPVAEILGQGLVHRSAGPALLIRRDGTERPIEASSSAIRDGGSGGLVVVVRDVSERLRIEEAENASRKRLRLALEAGRLGAWDWDLRTGRVAWSESSASLFSVPALAGESTFARFLELVHPEDVSVLDTAIAQSIEHGHPFEAEFRLRRPDGSFFWMASRGAILPDEEGRPVRLLGIGADVTERRRAEQTSRFLAEAGAALASLTDEDEALRRVARLAVPFFADWAAVDLIDPSGTIRRVAMAHDDPAKARLALKWHRRHPPCPDSPRGISAVIRTGQPELVAEIDDQMLEQAVGDPVMRRFLRDLNLRSFICVPLRDRAQRVIGALTFVSAESGRRFGPDDLAVAEDLAHRAAVALENSRLYGELREADQRKTEFLAILAHELRNPLAPIRTALELLRPTKVAPPADGQPIDREAIRAMACRQVTHMARLIDDLMDITRISRGTIELRPEPVELVPLIRRVVSAAGPQVAEAGLELRVGLPEQPLWLHADPARIEQILWNLLTNATKYSDPGGRIELVVAPDDLGVALRVRDTGIGIEPAMLPRIFELFEQAENGASRKRGGLGIGLSLVRTLVELHGGSISARSDGPGRGSEFVVTLPVMEAPPHAASRPKAQKPEATISPSTRRRILLVDDNRDAATSLGTLLGKLGGHQVRLAHDGPEAIRIASEFAPEVVLLDIGLPGMDGFEVARRLRAASSAHQATLIALTGWGQEEDRRRSREAGFDYHLVKPVDTELVEELIGSSPPPRRPGPH